MDHTNGKRRPRNRGGALSDGEADYLAILYVRSPSALLDDSIFSPPLLPKILTKPRTVWACHLVAAMISASVAPLARFIKAMTSTFLLARSAFGLLAAFFGWRPFFAVLAFLVVVRLSLVCGALVAGRAPHMAPQ